MLGSCWAFFSATLRCLRHRPIKPLALRTCEGFLRLLRRPAHWRFSSALPHAFSHGPPYYTFLTLHLEIAGLQPFAYRSAPGRWVVAEILLLFMVMAKYAHVTSMQLNSVLSCLPCGCVCVGWLLGSLADHPEALLLAQLLHARLNLRLLSCPASADSILFSGSFSERLQGQARRSMATLSKAWAVHWGRCSAGVSSWTSPLARFWTFALGGLAAICRGPW